MKLNFGRARFSALVRPAPLICAMLALALLLPVAAPRTATADPIQDYRPSTAAEKRFIKRLIKGVNGTLPLPGEGWKVDEMRVEKLKAVPEASTYLNDDGSNAMFYEYECSEPVRLSWLVKFRLPSSTEVKETTDREQYNRSMEEMQQELMKAVMSGDTARMERLQEEMGKKTTGLVAPALNPCAFAVRPASSERPAKTFQVTVELNKDFGGRIGKKFEVSMPGARRAFRIDSGKMRTYKYFLGDWDVTSKRKDWVIAMPGGRRTAANHLKTLNIYVKISGEREVVDAYVRDRFRPGALKALLD